MPGGDEGPGDGGLSARAGGPLTGRPSDGRFARLTAYELAHLTAHLEAAQLSDDLHRLLALEDAEGRNEWHAVRDAPDSRGYLADLERGWRLAEVDAKASADGRTIGIQVRYALIRASLGSLFSSMSGDLLAALVEDGDWGVDRALTVAGQQVDPDARADALTALLPHLDPDAAMAGLAAVHTIPAPAARARALVRYVAVLRPGDRRSALEEARAAVLAVAREADRGELAAELVNALPVEEREWAVELALAELGSLAAFSFDRAGAAVSAMGAGLTERLAEVALDEVRQMDLDWAQASVIGPLLAWLPDRLLDPALDIVERLDEYHRAKIMEAAVTSFPPRLHPRVLDLALDVQIASYRARALSGLIGLSGDALRRGVEAARSLAADDRAVALAGLVGGAAGDVEESVVADALERVRRIRQRDICAQALALLAPRISRSLLARAVRVPNRRWPPTLRAKALAALAAASEEPDCTATYRAALDALRRRRWSWAGHDPPEPFLELVRRLPLSLLGEAAATARTFGQWTSRAQALLAVASRLGETARAELVEEVADTIPDEHWDEGVRLKVLARTAASGPSGRRQRALRRATEASRRIGDAEDVQRALGALVGSSDYRPTAASDLPAVLAALNDSTALLDNWADRLPEGELEQALAEARRLPDARQRAVALASLLPRFDDVVSTTIAMEALAAARDMLVPVERVRALVAVARRGPDAALPNVVKAAGAERRTTEMALRALAPLLPEPLIRDAYHRGARLKGVAARLRLLAALAPWLPDDLLEDACALANSLLPVAHVEDRTGYEPPDRMLDALTQRLLAAGRVDVALRLAVTERTGRPARVARIADAAPQQMLEALLAAHERAAPGEWLAEAVAALAPHVDRTRLGPLLAAALERARGTTYASERCRLTVGLVAHIPPSERGRLLADVLLDDDAPVSVRVESVVQALPALAEPERAQALADALVLANGTDGYDRGKSLVALLPHLSEPERATALDTLRDEALAAADFETPAQWGMELAAAGACAEGLEIALITGDDSPGAAARLGDALVEMAPWLPRPILQQAMEALWSIRQLPERDYRLGRLAGRLPPDELVAAIRRARQIKSASSMSELAPALTLLPRPIARAAFHDVLRQLATQRRGRFLGDLSRLAGVLDQLGAQAALREAEAAVNEVGRWWP